MTSIETKRGGTRWNAQVVTPDGFEHELRIDGDGGSVLRGPTKEDDDAADRAEHKARVKAAKLDYATAAEKVVAAVPGARIVELNLDDRRGRTVWEADLVGPDGTKHEVKLDAASGAVVSKITGTHDDDD